MKLQINRFLWRSLILELRDRGEGRRESGAFLLGKPQSNRVSELVYYNDLDPTALDTGYIALSGEGFARLWDYCQKAKLEPYADIHTHGDRWTGQSQTDRTNPFVALPGHLSLIAPYYAKKNAWNLKGVGIYEYLGDHRWKTYSVSDRRVQLTLL